MRVASTVGFVALAALGTLRPLPATAAEGTVTAVPLYHLYRWSPNNMHFYTARLAEKEEFVAKGWKDGGPYAYISLHPFAGGVFFWRLWHPGTGDYYYTADPLSRDDYVQRRGYMPQKAAGHVLPPGTQRPGTVPLYMGYDDYQKQHFYSTDKTNFDQGNYKYVMEACRVWPAPTIVSAITVTSPKPGDVLTVGTTHKITWTTTVPDGGVSLQLSTDGGASWTPLGGKAVPNTGSLAFIVTAPVTDHATIRARWVDKVVDTGVSWATHVTQGEFRIVSAGNPPPPPPPGPGPQPPLPGKLPPFPGKPPPLPGTPPQSAPHLTAWSSAGPGVHLRGRRAALPT